MTEADIEIILERAKEFQPGTPLSLEDGRCLVEGYVEHYNNVRLNSAMLHHTEGHARRASAGDPLQEGPEACGSAETTADSSAEGRVKNSGSSTMMFAHNLLDLRV